VLELGEGKVKVVVVPVNPVTGFDPGATATSVVSELQVALEPL
jgi:hypothetical protein